MTILEYGTFWFACAALLVLPGILVARAAGTLSVRLPLSERCVPAILLSAGYLGLVWWCALLTGASLDLSLGIWLAGIPFLAVGGEWMRRRLQRSNGERLEFRIDPPGPAWAVWAPLPLIVVAFVVVLRDGGSLGYIHDSLDFVAFVRRMLETGRVDIVSGAYKDVEGMGPDARRGAFHFGMALLCRATGADPVFVWRALPSFLVPMALWVFYTAMRRVLCSSGAAFFSLLFFVGVLLFRGDHYLHNLAYASRLGWVLSWIGLWAVAVFLDADHADRAPGSWRARIANSAMAGRGALTLAILGAPILLGLHILSAFQYLIALGAFCWAWALSPLEPRPARRWLWRLPILAAIAMLPALVLKMSRSFNSDNPIFDHALGLLYFTDSIAIMAPDRIVSWLHWPGFLGCLLVLLLIPRFRERRDFAFLVGSTLIPFLIIWNPLAIWVIEKGHAHSLLFRVILVIPFFQALGFFTIWAVRRLMRTRSPWVLGPALAYLAIMGLFLSLHMKSAIEIFERPERMRAPWLESQPLIRSLEFLQGREQEPVVIVSDPVTSYQIPAYSRHYAIAPFGQHSSPADSRSVERIIDATAVGSAYVSLEETIRILRKYDAEYVLLNQSFPRYVKFQYSFITPHSFPEERKKFESEPAVFEPIYDAEGILVLKFHDPGPGRSFAETGSPYLLLSPEEAGGTNARELARRLGARPIDLPALGGLEPIGVVWDSTTFRAGDYIKLKSYWRHTGEPYVQPVESFFRASTTYPNALFDHPWVGKPYRRFYEKHHQVTYRFGRSHLPLEGFFPVFLWEPGAVYSDEFWIPIPRHAVPGPYEVTLTLFPVPNSPNYHATDFVRLDDSLQGIPIGEIEILPPEDAESTETPE